MTLRITTGKSLSKAFFAQKAKLAWINKLYGNIRKSLDRLGNLVVLDQKCLNSTSDTITLYYSGSVADRTKIGEVLDVVFISGSAVVKFSRITLTVNLVKNKEALAKVADYVAARKAA